MRCCMHTVFKILISTVYVTRQWNLKWIDIFKEFVANHQTWTPGIIDIEEVGSCYSSSQVQQNKVSMSYLGLSLDPSCRLYSINLQQFHLEIATINRQLQANLKRIKLL